MESTFCYLFLTDTHQKQPYLYSPKNNILCPNAWLIKLFRIPNSWRVITSSQQNNNSKLSAVRSKMIRKGVVRNHLNIKSLGNYSGIHPSLITPEGGSRGNVVKIIVEEINCGRHAGWQLFADRRTRVCFLIKQMQRCSLLGIFIADIMSSLVVVIVYIYLRLIGQ